MSFHLQTIFQATLYATLMAVLVAVAGADINAPRYRPAVKAAFFAALLSVAAAYLSAVDSVLYLTLAIKQEWRPKDGILTCNLIMSATVCFIFVFGAGSSFTFCVLAFLKQYMPSLIIVYSVIVAISCLFTCLPTLILVGCTVTIFFPSLGTRFLFRQVGTKS